MVAAALNEKLAVRDADLAQLAIQRLQIDGTNDRNLIRLWRTVVQAQLKTLPAEPDGV